MLARHLPLVLLGILGLIAYLDLRSSDRKTRDEIAGEIASLAARIRPPGGPASRPEGSDHANGQPQIASPPDRDCTGTIDTDQLRPATGKLRSRILECYGKALIADPGLEIGIEFDIRVGADGTVENVSTLSPSTDQQFLFCMIEQVHASRFPKPSGGDCAMVPVAMSLEPSMVDPAAE